MYHEYRSGICGTSSSREIGNQEWELEGTKDWSKDRRRASRKCRGRVAVVIKDSKVRWENITPLGLVDSSRNYFFSTPLLVRPVFTEERVGHYG